MGKAVHNSFVESVMRNALPGRVFSVTSVGTGIMSSASSWKYRFYRRSKNFLKHPTFANHAVLMRRELSAMKNPLIVCTRYTWLAH